MYKPEDIASETNTIANEFAVELIFALANCYDVSIDVVLKVFDKIGYWNVINDDDVCCELAHDGIAVTIQTLKGDFNEVLPWDG